MKYTIHFLLSIVGMTVLGNPANAQSATINTFAGTGSSGWTGDGGLAISAEISLPNSVIVDGSGNVFISDAGNNRVRMVNTSGVIINIAGNGTAGFSGDGGPATAASINTPASLAMDAAGNLYVTDYNNEVIRKISPAINGTISTVAGTHGVIGFSGSGGPATAAKFYHPYGLAFDSYGNLYMADQHNNVIWKITALTDTIAANNIISRFAGTGIGSFLGDGGAASSAHLNLPNCIWIDHLDNLFISDNGNQRIRKVNANDTISTIVGTGIGGFVGDGGAATNADINFPAGMKTDDLGNFYFCDAVNNRIRKVNNLGIISTIAGSSSVPAFGGDGGPATAAKFNLPNDIAIDHLGNILIADNDNSRIRIINVSNFAPEFVHGNIQSISLCEDVPGISLDSQLTIIDSDMGQTETWRLVTPPTHGTASVSFTAASTGGIIRPFGLTYTPASSFSGADIFTVSISDGIFADTVSIAVVTDPLPNPGVIAGTDTVCPGASVYLSESVHSGIWSTSSSVISIINSSGVATGLLPGKDTVIYTVINGCGVASVIFPFKVSSYAECGTGLKKVAQQNDDDVRLYPNPGTGKFTVKVPSDATPQATISVTNLMGEILENFVVTTNVPTELNINLTPGIYIMNITTFERRYMEKVAVIK